MRVSSGDARGFTLVEALVVLGMFAVVSTALYAMYLTHLRNASHHDQLLEVQQNMRIALDSISRDLMMAGILVPSTGSFYMPAFDPALASGPTGTSVNSLLFYTASADRVFARITHVNRDGVAPFKNLTTSVDAESALNFNAGDVVRIVRPAYSCAVGGGNEPLRCQYSMADYSSLVVAPSPAAGVISLRRANPANNFDSGISLRQGDVIAKKGATGAYVSATPDSVNYSLATGTDTNGCPVGQTCLFRSVNGAQLGAGNLVAGYMQSLTFTPNYTMVAGQYKLISVFVDLVGTTTQPSQITKQLVTREMKTLIRLRQ
jgi:prepilin-type N-terminal cleavage/methylation domain-containing protein